MMIIEESTILSRHDHARSKLSRMTVSIQSLVVSLAAGRDSSTSRPASSSVSFIGLPCMDDEI